MTIAPRVTNLPTPEDVPTLPTKPDGAKNIYWWGIVMLVTIELTLFTLMIASYFFLKVRTPAWPPTEDAYPELLLPTINTGVLILSGISMFIGDKAIKQGKQTTLKVAQGIALLLAIVFVVLKVYEYANKPYDWTTHTYGSMVFLMIFFHTMHVISVFLKGILVFYMALIGTYTRQEHTAVEVNGVYWQFVVVIWLPLYFTIYLSPYLF